MAKDWTGERFGHLLCTGKSAQRDGKGHVYWVFQCDCGSEPVERATKGFGNMPQSCGKCKREKRQPYPDQTGKKVGLLTVLEKDPNKIKESGKQPIYKCLCECGETTYVPAWLLHHTAIEHCGCKSKLSPRQKLERKYLDMIDRCRNPKNSNYKYYGARKIRVCKKWRISFTDFEKDMGYPPPGFGKDKYTLERINVNGNYEPNNCKWEPVKKQNNNKTNSRFITVDGKKRTVSEWSTLTGIDISRRLSEGWDEVKAVTTPAGFSKAGAYLKYDDFFDEAKV